MQIVNNELGSKAGLCSGYRRLVNQLVHLYKNYKLHALVLNLPVSFYDLAFLEMQGVDNEFCCRVGVCVD